MKQRKHIVLIFAVVLPLIVLLIAPSPTQAATPNNTFGQPTYITYIVKHGDTLASIGRQFCTSWQAIYTLNRNVIGPDPNHLVAGMAITIPANCHGGDCRNVYDRGWLPHAQGHITPPNHYWVIRGDTWYSIGKRFGVSVNALRQANGVYYPYAYTWVTIPCLKPISPTPVPITPTPTPPVVQPAFLTITSPPANAVLPHTFVVSGHGGNLPEANVVVHVKDEHGLELAIQSTILQGPNVGVGGEGDWSVQFTLASLPAAGVIEASSPGTNAFASVHVFFQNTENIDYTPGQCHINIKANAIAYNNPNGAVLGVFPQAITMEALRRERIDNVDWYQITVPIDETSTPAWVPESGVESVDSGC